MSLNRQVKINALLLIGPSVGTSLCLTSEDILVVENYGQHR